MFAATLKLFVVLVLVSMVYAAPTPELYQVVTVDQRTGASSYSHDGFEKFLLKYSGPFYFFATVGDARSGKSASANFRVQLHNKGPVPKQATFRVCNELEPCTKGIDVVAVPRAGDKGTDLFFDAEGGSLAENLKELSVLLTMGACISSAPLVIVNAVLDDKTVQLAGRVAAHLLDQSSTSKPKGASCSFREGGPALAIVVNKNDGAVRQEAQPGGLRGIWDKLAAARADDAAVRLFLFCGSVEPTLKFHRLFSLQVINQVFKSIDLFALPYEKDLNKLSDPTSDFGKKMRSLDEQVVRQMKPVTLVSESNVAVRYAGTPATIAAAVGDIFTQAKALSKTGFYGAPRVRDIVTRDAAKAAGACLATFQTAYEKKAATACEARCSGEGRGCQVVHEWLAPARTAAEKCFVDATAKWREGGNPFGASVLDPALKQLNADTQHRADELHNVWQQANSVDPARTQHESRTRELRRWGPEQCSKRYGGRTYVIVGGKEYADFCTYAEYAVEARSCTFKRCGASLGCTDWAETTRFEKEVAREQKSV
jgi:hypothetical protein